MEICKQLKTFLVAIILGLIIMEAEVYAGPCAPLDTSCCSRAWEPREEIVPPSDEAEFDRVTNFDLSISGTGREIDI
jgi:hypothetical protein